MSRPTQEKLADALRQIEDGLNNKRVQMPFRIADDIGRELRWAHKSASDVAAFVALSNRAFEALEGLLANWPSTDAAGKYVPSHAPVMMKDKAIDEAVKALAEYRECEGDFTW